MNRGRPKKAAGAAQKTTILSLWRKPNEEGNNEHDYSKSVGADGAPGTLGNAAGNTEDAHDETGKGTKDSKVKGNFRLHGQNDYKFLKYDTESNTMFCSICRNSKAAGPARDSIPFIVGTSNFNLAAIKLHG